MTQLDSPQLDYGRPPPRNGGRWAVASVCVGAGSILLALALPAAGGFVRRFAAPSTARAVVYTAAVFIVGVGPLVGTTLGGIGLRRTMRRRRLALVGIGLNLALWAGVLLLLFSQKR